MSHQTQEVVAYEDNTLDLTTQPKSQWTQAQYEIVKRTIAPDLNEDELMIFSHICHRVRLDPFARQIYAIKRGGKMCIQTGIDGFRLVAERTGKYAPGNDTEFLYDDKNRLVGAKVYVKKLTPDGTWHNISATAFLSEYNPNQGLWRKMPHVMIEKCAEARALRRAFPADLSGLYSEDEMDQADSKNQPPLPQKVEEPRIPEEKAKEIDAWINGRDDIRKAILNLCKVNTVYEIKESQLEACRNYVAKRKGTNENTAQKQLPAPTA